MLEFRELQELNHPDFRTALKIYTDSLPPNMLQATTVIEQRIEEKLSQLFVGKLEERVVCIALLYLLNHPEFVLLDYLETEQNSRGQGLGTKLMEYILKNLKSSQKTLLIEVENPTYAEHREESERRINFYKRLGAKILKDVRYVLPPFAGDVPTEMLLMLVPDYKDGKIEGELVKRLIKQMYEEVYNRDESDRLLNSFINDIGETVELI